VARINTSAQLAVLAATWGAVGTAGCAHDQLGTGVWVRSFRIEGTGALSESQIRDRLATQKTAWWPFAPKQWFDQAAFDLDLRRIPALYADHGYFDARVTRHQVTHRPDDSVDIVVALDEGLPTAVRQVTVQGLPAGWEARARKLGAKSAVEPHRTFDYGGFTTFKADLDRALREDGYAYAHVEGDAAVDRDARTADISITVTPGPQVRFGQTTVEGNGNLPARPLLNRVTWDPGDLYDPRAVAATQGLIRDLGAFSSVRVELPEAPTAHADVRIIVHPGLLRDLRVGGGLGADLARDEVHARFEYTRSNFLGGLRQLRVRVKPAYVVIPGLQNIQRSGPALESDVQVTQPDLFGTRVSASALVGWDLEVFDAYQYYGPRAQVGVDRFFFNQRLLTGLSWNLQRLTFFNVDQSVFTDASSAFYGFQNPSHLAYIEALARLNLRVPPFQPQYGGYMFVRGEVGNPQLGSDFHYFKITPDLRLYAPIGPRVVLGVRGLFGWLHPYGGQSSPTTRRYYLGGPSTHRGFGFGRLSPQVLDTSGQLVVVGGNAEVLFSGEVRYDVVKVGGNWLGVTPFVDAGDVTPSLETLNLSNLNYAVGAALTYETPIGTVRADVGMRVNRLGPGNPDPGDRFAFHLAIGEAF
jgi:outer membrane protein assembly factor BamA